MSLVVADATDQAPKIVSDTRVVFPEGPRSSFKNGTLKAIVVSRDITVCLAGDVAAGLDGVRGFARELRQGAEVETLLPRLQEMTTDARRSVEFIIAAGGADAQLIRIRDSEIERGLSTAWIGDQQAFERFQQERHNPNSLMQRLKIELPLAARIMETLQRSMRAVIDDPAIETVDDFCVGVSYKPTGFQYLESTFIHVGRDIRVEPGEDLISRMAQSVEEGGYAVSVVEPSEPGTPALGLSFPRARLGMMYLPLQFDEAQVISDVSAKDFANVVFDKFQVAMKNPMLK